MRSVGLDSSFADGLNATSLIFGSAAGETFRAVDTVITSITVWRLAGQTPNATPVKLWITEVDSLGRPLTDQVVLDGPTTSVVFGDGVNPTEIRYDLNPPALLPSPGTYAFFVQQLCDGVFDLYFTPTDEYPDGSFWLTGRSHLSGCTLRMLPNEFAETDLVFTIEFCADATTSTKSKSWGQLKLIYR